MDPFHQDHDKPSKFKIKQSPVWIKKTNEFIFENFDFVKCYQNQMDIDQNIKLVIALVTNNLCIIKISRRSNKEQNQIFEFRSTKFAIFYTFIPNFLCTICLLSSKIKLSYTYTTRLLNLNSLKYPRSSISIH